MYFRGSGILALPAGEKYVCTSQSNQNPNEIIPQTSVHFAKFAHATLVYRIVLRCCRSNRTGVTVSGASSSAESERDRDRRVGTRRWTERAGRPARESTGDDYRDGGNGWAPGGGDICPSTEGRAGRSRH